ncbi:MAG: PAS domain S-box protein [Bacteroidota bacterium]
MSNLNLLLLEDDVYDARLVERVLTQSGMAFQLTVVSDEQEFTEALQKGHYDAILADNTLPQFDATYALEIVKELQCTVPFILITGAISEEFAVSIMKQGAWDYLLKDRLQRLPNAITSAIGKHHLQLEQQRALNAIAESEKKYRNLFENSPFPQWVIDCETSRFLDVNITAVKHYGYTREEFLSMTAVDIRPEEEKERYLKEKTLLREGFSNRGIWKHIKKDGTVILVDISIDEIIFEGTRSHLVIVNDVTAKKDTEEKLINANRMYAFISQVNQAIVHINDEQTLFDEACRIATEVGKFEVACIASTARPDRKVKLISQHRIDCEDAELTSTYEYAEKGPLAKVVQSNIYYVINDYANEAERGLWTEYASRQKLQSGIHLPLKRGGKTEYIFSIFNKKVNFFNQTEIALLVEAAGDISFALDTFENEKQKILAEAKLTHSELRLRQAQEIAHFGHWELSLATGKAAWSEEALRIYGIPVGEKEQTFDSWLSYIHPDDREEVLIEIGKGRETLSKAAFYHRIIRKDGTVRYIYSVSDFEFGDEGRPVGLHGVAHDVTEIRQSELALLQSQENLRTIVDLIPQAIFAMDGEGKLVFANKSFAALHGHTPESVVSKYVSELLADQDEAAAHVQQGREIIASGIMKVIPEMPCKDYTGQEKIFYSVKVPYIPAGDGAPAMLGISLDITEQQVAERERSKMIVDIIQRNKDLEQFSYIVSHNLRAPVANIIGLAELLQIFAANEQERNEMMSGLSTSVKKLDDVIKDLNYVLQVKHQVSEKREKLLFSELLSDIKLSIQNLLQGDHVTIKSDFSEVNELSTLKSYLYSVFFNLISNSIKYRQREVAPVIDIKSFRTTDGISLMFKDNGMGIDLKQKGEQVFGLYKRFHQHAEGKGMGLYMVKTQVETLGGKISIESEVNKGTIFTITFKNL